MATARIRFRAAAALLIGTTAALSVNVAGFGDPGHRIVGLIAERHLRGSRALTEARKILRPGEALSDASVWPDTIKRATYEDGDTAAFRLEHPAHDVYHFANLPFQASGYDPSIPGARPGDIVQTARECIRVLRGRSSVFTPREALRLLAHLVGDLHQPLHVGTGFVAADGLRFIAPQGPTGWRVTLGGNALVYGPQDRFNLHSYWDAHAVNLAMRNDAPPAYARRLLDTIAVEPGWRAGGDADSWPEQWAGEALTLAKTAHAGIRLIAYLGPDESGRTAHRWRIEQPQNYDAVVRQIVPAQLAKAGYRLAAVLVAIWP